MKIKIPATIKVQVDGADAGALPFAQFVRHMLDTDKRANDTGVHIRSAVRIDAALSKAAPGDEVELEKADLELLLQISEQPESGYPTAVITTDNGAISRQIVRQLLPYLDAIACAASPARAA
jgi:hypothetical protein